MAHHPSDALRRCIRGVCPWCVLQVQHGNLREALHSFNSRRMSLEPDCTRGRFILQHCKIWIADLVEADIDQGFESSSTDEDLVPPTPFSIFTPGASGGASAGHAASSSSSGACCATGGNLMPPPPPGLAPWSSWIPLPAPPPVPGSGWLSRGHGWIPDQVWQYWGGRKTKWQDYSPEVSAALACMAREGPPSRDFGLGGCTYRINVVALTQNRLDTDAPSREIRVRPDDGDVIVV